MTEKRAPRLTPLEIHRIAESELFIDPQFNILVSPKTVPDRDGVTLTQHSRGILKETGQPADLSTTFSVERRVRKARVTVTFNANEEGFGPMLSNYHEMRGLTHAKVLEELAKMYQFMPRG